MDPEKREQESRETEETLWEREVARESEERERLAERVQEPLEPADDA